MENGFKSKKQFLFLSANLTGRNFFAKKMSNKIKIYVYISGGKNIFLIS